METINLLYIAAGALIGATAGTLIGARLGRWLAGIDLSLLLWQVVARVRR